MEIEKILDQLLSLSYENEMLEFKEAKTQYDFNKLGKYFSALSNEANLNNKKRAWLVFGIKDDRSIVGTSFRIDETSLNRLSAEIANHTNNRITLIHIHKIFKKEKRVLMFEIPAAPKGIPVSWKGHYYGRDGEELHALNLEEIERIRSQSTWNDWSSVICEDATIEDLSEDAIRKAKAYYSIKNPKQEEVSEWDEITFLNKAKLAIKNKITRAAIILLGKPESEHFISPASTRISWILKDRDGIEKDYEHFSCPLLLSVEKLYKKVRILKYRYMTENSMFPEEVNQYNFYTIREALNNCIAHRDYTSPRHITFVENDNESLVFTNPGGFIPESVEEVIKADAPESHYRNPLLANAMVNLNMIDTIGSGIRKMFLIQKNKFFPLPEYDLTDQQVKLTIIGKVIDINYATKLAQMPELNLLEIMMLDKVQKNKQLTKFEIKHLRSKKLIEGRKPNFHISSKVAENTGQKVDYIKMKGIDDGYCQKIILDYLEQFGEAPSKDFESILFPKLPEFLDDHQKKSKLKNILQKMKKEGSIELSAKRNWKKYLDEV